MAGNRDQQQQQQEKKKDEKSESRLCQSPLNSEKQQMKKKKSIIQGPANKGELSQPMVYKPKESSTSKESTITPLKESKDKKPTDEEASDDPSTQEVVEKPGTRRIAVITFGAPPTKIKKSKAQSPGYDTVEVDERFPINVETIMTDSKALVIMATKQQTVKSLRTSIRAKTKARHFGIYYNNKELVPENSTLESHGIIQNCKIRLHVKAQTGTSDQEDINSLIRLTKSFNDLKTLVGSLQQTVGESKDTKKTRTRAKKPFEPVKKAEEDVKARDKMAILREKLAQRNGKTSDKTKQKKKKKSRKDGGIAGQYPLPPTVHAGDNATAGGSTNSDPTNNSAEETSDREKIRSTIPPGIPLSVFESSIELGQGPVTNKELLLYFDPPESEQKAKLFATELFDPPTDAEQLEKMRIEFKTCRCALCFTRLPLTLREMPCRCGKVYCQFHRSPVKHSCAVDLKKVDRIKLEKDVPKAASVSQKTQNEEDDPQPKSSNKKLL